MAASMRGRSRPPRSLQAKALQLLAQREQSRVELRRKLIAHAHAADKAEAEQARFDAGSVVDADPETSRHGSDVKASIDGESPSIAARVDAVLVWLEAHRFSSDERFAESRVHARQGRFGNLRIRQELATHEIELSAAATRELVESELQRAIDVAKRKFSMAPRDAIESARHARFLIARGFSPEVVRQALRSRSKQERIEACADGGEAQQESARVNADDV